MPDKRTVKPYVTIQNRCGLKEVVDLSEVTTDETARPALN